MDRPGSTSPSIDLLGEVDALLDPEQSMQWAREQLQVVIDERDVLREHADTAGADADHRGDAAELLAESLDERSHREAALQRELEAARAAADLQTVSAETARVWWRRFAGSPGAPERTVARGVEVLQIEMVSRALGQTHQNTYLVPCIRMTSREKLNL